jgi:hypothetical protein
MEVQNLDKPTTLLPTRYPEIDTQTVHEIAQARSPILPIRAGRYPREKQIGG